MSNQRIPTSNIVEVAAGAKLFVPHTITSLNPNTGSVQESTPDVTRIVGIDFQLSSLVVSTGAGASTVITWPAIGFPGLLTSTIRYYNTGAPGAVTPATVPAKRNNLATGQSTQLCLICSVQNWSCAVPIILGQISLPTFATTTQVPKGQFTGPWFSSGTEYTSFSCAPTTVVYTPTALTNERINLGVSATLYAIFIQ